MSEVGDRAPGAWWRDGLWATAARGSDARAVRVASRVDALHALLEAAGQLELATTALPQHPVTVVWCGHGRWAVVERTVRRQWIDAGATVSGTTRRSAGGDRIHDGPGAAMDALSALTLAVRVLDAGIAAPGVAGARSLELVR